MNRGLKIRSAKESDKEQVLMLLNDVFSSQQRMEYERDNAYWNWKFIDSVYGPSILTVAESEGEIIGVDHLWPWVFCFKGELLKAVQPCDAAVHKDYRGAGLFKQMRKFGLNEAEKKGFRLAFNFPNENSLPGNRSLGATYLGKITWWVRILKPVHLVANKLFNLKETNFILPEEYRLETEYLDRLSREHKPDERFIQIHRLPEFHQWRYSDHPSRRYGMVKIREDNKETALIFTVVQNGARLEMVVVDFVGGICSKKRIVQSMVQAAKKLDADFIAVMNNKMYGIGRLWTNLFIKKKLKNMVVLPVNSEIDKNITSFEHWSLMAGLHDSI